MIFFQFLELIFLTVELDNFRNQKLTKGYVGEEVAAALTWGSCKRFGEVSAALTWRVANSCWAPVVGGL